MADIISKSGGPAATPRKAHSKRLRLAVYGLVAVLLALSIYAIQGRSSPDAPRGGRRGNGGLPVPVSVCRVERRDIPITLDGIGTVQAFNSVTVRPRVDGELLKLTFGEGQDVKAGEVLATIDPAPYQASYDLASAKKAQDEAQLANARLDLARYEDLLASGGTTEQLFDTQKAVVAQLEALVRADAATVQSAGINLGYTTVRSPIDGRTGIRMVDAGNVVRASEATGIVVVTQLHPISLVFTLPETFLPRLREYGVAPGAEVQALSRDGSKVVARGKLAVIDNQIDTSTGTIRLKAEFDNTDNSLWPGQFVNARLLVTIRQDALVVPAGVVQRGPSGVYAFVVDDASVAKMRPIRATLTGLGDAIIEDGLAAGETVVSDGQYKLEEGSKVEVIDGSASPPPAARGSDELKPRRPQQ